MTELAITPNYEKKRLKLAGTVAAGEHVAVTIVGGGAWIGTGKALRLRVICCARTVAKFPLWTEDNAEDWPEDVTSADAWNSANEGADATCVLNLNTVPAAKLLRFGGMCLWVLDDAENHTLYGSGEYIVEPWPKERGEDEPYYLDEYPDIVAELGERIDAVEKSISDAVDEANGIVAYVTAARNDAQSAAQIAGTARNGAQTAQGKAEDAQTAAEAAQVAAEAALPLDTTLATEGKAADAKAVGDAIALKADKSTTYTKSETYTKIETTNAISSAIATVVDSAPEAFDTLKEIADWIEDDQSGAAAMAAAIKGKVDKVSGKGLSANDYTDAEKSKLAGIAAGAQVNPTPIAPANATESGMFADAYWTQQGLAGKADRVANATSGNLAAIDSNGNLVDSGNMVAGAFTAGSFIGGEGEQVGFQLDSTSEGVELYVHDGVGKILKFPLREGTLAVQDDIAPTFDETDAYGKGALVFHDGLYQCVNPNGHTGAWVAANFAEATVEDLLAALRTALSGKADASSLAPVATSGNYDDLRGKPGNVSAFANDAGYLTSHQQLRYAMPESVALVAENNAATLVCADRAVTNATIVTGFSTLNLSFPAAVSGYVRDFYLRITVAAGESAPAISVPQGITIENAGGAVPVIADGETDAVATTLVWFSETAPGVFTAKSETVKAVV